MGIFSGAQAAYADHGIATFPVDIAEGRKKPAISHYEKVGLPASRKLAAKFPTHDALGFMVRGAGLTILDIDSPDERALTEALDRHGPTPVVVRSGSGNHQCWYKHGGERRLIRPWPDLPIDVLGDGFVVAPPSEGGLAPYRFIQGSLDDIAALPPLRDLGLPARPVRRPLGPIPVGMRNRMLFLACMAQARFCDDLEALLDVACTFAADFASPMPDEEIFRTAASAWGYEERGENWVGLARPVGVGGDIDLLYASPDAHTLLCVVRHHNPRGTFLVANDMHASMPPRGWTERRFKAARAHLEDAGILICVRRFTRRTPTLYRWGQTHTL